MYKIILLIISSFLCINAFCQDYENDEKMLEAQFEQLCQTKDSRHLKDILTYIKQQDDKVVFWAYEWKNREVLNEMIARLVKNPSKDVNGLEEFEKSLQKEKELDKVILTRWVMEYLQYLQKQDPTIKDMGKNLIQEDPSLDYWARVFKMVGYSYNGFNAF